MQNGQKTARIEALELEAVSFRYELYISVDLTGMSAMSHPRISSDPAVMMGKPCIKGTRITVELILRELGAGHSFADLLDAYPHLTEDDLRQRWHLPRTTCSKKPFSRSIDVCSSLQSQP